ncbi:MAG TPA: hypothetical protein VGP33_09330 [Chloroflexota bacterium]|nr:hypothetical protein [Chloroflexota bacterium]
MNDSASPLCAALDIGSATVHLLIARLAEDGTIVRYHEASVRPLLGARRGPDGAIPADAAEDVTVALRHYRDVVHQFGVQRFFLVATEAVRSAPNRAALIQRWQDAIDQPIIVLAASQETRLAMLGAYAGCLPSDGLFADSGGASTQVAAIAGGKIAWQRSFPVGAGSLTARYLASDPPAPAELDAADCAIGDALATLPPAPSSAGLQRVITGGSASTLLLLAPPGDSPGALTIASLTQAADLLAREPSRTLAQRFNLPPERTRILGAGCLIVRRLLVWSGSSVWRASVAGIREGIIRAWATNPHDWPAITGAEAPWFPDQS